MRGPAGRVGGARRGAEAWPGDDRVALRFAAGEPGSLEAIVFHFAEGLYPLAVRLAGPANGEAVLEKAFLRAAGAREEYRGDPPLLPWLQGLVEESARAFPAPAGEGDDGEVAAPFALSSRLVARLEEKQAGPGAAIRKLGILGKRTRFIALAGVFLAAVLWMVNRAAAPPRPPPGETGRAGDGAVAVFFDSSDVVKEAVTLPGRMAVVTLQVPPGADPGWRLSKSAMGARLPSALTAMFRLDLDPSGRVTAVHKLFSVPSVPPAGTEQLLQRLVFDPVPGIQQAGAVEVRVVAEQSP